MKLDFGVKLNKNLSDALLGVRWIYSGVKSQFVFREIYRTSGKRNDLKKLNQSEHIFQYPKCFFQILGAGTVTRGKGCTEDPQMFRRHGTNCSRHGKKCSLNVTN